MNNDELKELLGSIVSSARQVNILTGDHAQAVYQEGGSSGEVSRSVSDVQVSRAIAAINCEGGVLNKYLRWFGVVHYLSSMCGWPSNVEECCMRINQLPGRERWALECKYESIRKFPADRYAKIPYSEWEEYRPSITDKYFYEFRDVARAFEQQLRLKMMQP